MGALLIVGLIAGAIVGVKAWQFSSLEAAAESMQPPPTSITEAVVTRDAWVQRIRVVGTLEAVNGVTVEAERDGKITELVFKPGQSVEAGDLLLRQDAKAQIARLRSLEATAELARIEFERSEKLLRDDTIAQSEFDQAKAEYDVAVAEVENQREEVAKLEIRAPFAGRLGVRLVDVGQILEQGAEVVSLQSLDPIFVNFSVPQHRLALLSEGMQVSVSNSALGREHDTVGEITAINPQVNAVTRNVLVQATLQNPKEILRPGMFVNVAVTLPEARQVLRIPQTAVLSATYGDTVFIVQESEGRKTVRQEIVRLGEQRGDFVEVLSGLEEGTTIVSTGVFRLQNNAPVAVNKSVEPEFGIDPEVDNS
ncbi:MAG: efflux RND transporter periplasmic adaptor subunit [Opitutales bacterium]